MKKQVLAVISAVMFAAAAQAVPQLQLDISNGVYNTGDETIYNSTDPFKLYALAKTDSLAGTTYYLSIAILPKTSDLSLVGFGSFSIDGVTINAGSGWTFGVPPLDSSIANIPQHGAFPTLFIERSFNLLEGFAEEYDTQTNPGGFDDYDGSGKKLAYKDFDINTSNLGANYALHFDLYTYASGGTRVSAFAPFSHDAQTTKRVPDGGATIILFGTALAGIGVIRRYLKA